MGLILEVHFQDSALLASTVRQTGTASTESWAPATASPLFGQAGRITKSAYYTGASRQYVYGPTTPYNYNLVEPAVGTILVWVKFLVYPPTYNGHIVHKVYRTGTDWSSPYYSWGIQIQPGTGKISTGVNVLGTVRSSGWSASGISANVWHMLGVSYDAAGMHKRYIDNTVTEHSFSAASYAIDYGTHGKWMVGHCNDGSGAVEPITAYIDYFAVFDEVLSDENVLARYYQSERKRRLNQIAPAGVGNLPNSGVN